jgi:hypothetical protein
MKWELKDFLPLLELGFGKVALVNRLMTEERLAQMRLKDFCGDLKKG